MVFHWSRSDIKPPELSRTLRNILLEFNNQWTVCTRPLISKFSHPCINHLVTVPSPPITNGITISFMFHCFFSSLARSWYLYLFSPYLLTVTRYFRLAEIKWSVCISKSQRTLYISFCRTNSGLCIYHIIIIILIFWNHTDL